MQITATQANCPKTGRSASACDTTDHSNCPDLLTEATMHQLTS